MTPAAMQEMMTMEAGAAGGGGRGGAGGLAPHEKGKGSKGKVKEKGRVGASAAVPSQEALAQAMADELLAEEEASAAAIKAGKKKKKKKKKKQRTTSEAAADDAVAAMFAAGGPSVVVAPAATSPPATTTMASLRTAKVAKPALTSSTSLTAPAASAPTKKKAVAPPPGFPAAGGGGGGSRGAGAGDGSAASASKASYARSASAASAASAAARPPGLASEAGRARKGDQHTYTRNELLALRGSPLSKHMPKGVSAAAMRFPPWQQSQLPRQRPAVSPFKLLEKAVVEIARQAKEAGQQHAVPGELAVLSVLAQALRRGEPVDISIGVTSGTGSGKASFSGKWG